MFCQTLTQQPYPTLIWIWHKDYFAHQPPKNSMSVISLLWPDFDQTLKIGFWGHSKQMRTVTETIVLVTFVLVGGGANHFKYFYSIKGCFLLKVVFHWRYSSTQCYPLSGDFKCVLKCSFINGYSKNFSKSLLSQMGKHVLKHWMNMYSNNS